jgi:hypothetical protein
MPYEVHVIKAGDFIRCGGEGAIDFETSRRALKSFADALVSRGIKKAILDIRKVYGDPPATYTQLYQLAKVFREAGFGPGHRLAVVISPDRYDKAEFFAMCAAGRGWNAWAFDEFEDAFDWLTEEMPINPSV